MNVNLLQAYRDVVNEIKEKRKKDLELLKKQESMSQPFEKNYIYKNEIRLMKIEERLKYIEEEIMRIAYKNLP